MSISSLSSLVSLHVIVRSVHAWAGSARPAHLPCLQKLVAEEQVRGNTRAGRNTVSKHPEGIIDTLELRIHGLASLQIKANDVAVGNLIAQSRHFVMISIYQSK